MTPRIRKPNPKAAMGAASVLAASAVAAALLPPGAQRWGYRLALMGLGLIASAIVYLLVRSGSQAPQLPGMNAAEIRGLFKRARKRLSELQGGIPLGKRPAVLFMGPTFATKTTVILHSGVDPDLVVGETDQEGTVTPSVLNMWLAKESILMEAGGSVLDDEVAWTALCRELRPPRLAASLAGRKQAPRAAVVCFPAELLVDHDGGERLRAEATRLRHRVGEVANALGVDLPVYVLFTRSDQIPHFEAYVSSFRHSEVESPLGVCLPFLDLDSRDAENYRGRESKRIGGYLDRLLYTLSLERGPQLMRVAEADVRARLYEFPREMARIRERLVEALVEIGRPSRSIGSPRLRGFYFTGVRPVVEETRAVGALATQHPPAGGHGAATLGSLQAEQPDQPEPGLRGLRRRPQWVFLEKLFKNVLLGDTTARQVTSTGARVDLFRRSLLTGLAAAAGLLIFGFTLSWGLNRSFLESSRRHVANLQSAERSLGVPDLAVLHRMDSLRTQIDDLREWRDGPPIARRFGLYKGRAVEPSLRDAYFAQFDLRLGQETRAALEQTLARAPSAERTDAVYQETYDALKAYLASTVPQFHDSVTVDYLAPALAGAWASNRTVSDAERELTDLQFTTFAGALPDGDVEVPGPDARLVAGARETLTGFGTDGDGAYQAMLARVSAPPIRFADASGSVRGGVTVPGAFTRAGWTSVQAALASGSSSVEAWVLGVREQSLQTPADVRARHRARYTQEFIQTWSRFLTEAQVAGFNSVGAAARRLERLADNESPLLQLFAVASRNTFVDGGPDAERVKAAFQSLHTVSPPEETTVLVTEATQGYIGALASLYQTFNDASTQNGDAQLAALANATGGANQVEGAVQSLSQGFSLAPEGRSISQAVERLMRAPAERARRFAVNEERAGPQRAIAAAGRAFCEELAPLLDLYPFRSVPNSINPQDLTDRLRPGSGAIWATLSDMEGFVERRGTRWVAVRGANPAPGPAFLETLNRLSGIADALFSNPNAPGPSVQFSLRIEPPANVVEVLVQVGSRSERYTPTSIPRTDFTWDPGVRDAVIEVRPQGRPPIRLVQPGPWALFRIFGLAQWQTLGNGEFLGTWDMGGIDIEGEVRGAMQVPIFDSRQFMNLSCPSPFN